MQIKGDDKDKDNSKNQSAKLYNIMKEFQDIRNSTAEDVIKKYSPEQQRVIKERFNSYY